MESIEEFEKWFLSQPPDLRLEVTLVANKYFWDLIFAKLEQEPLGKEFQDVLDDNLENLVFETNKEIK